MKKRLLLLLIPMVAGYATLRAQTSEDSVLQKLTAIRDDYAARIKATGLTPSLPIPKIVLTNPRSWGNYDDTTNTIQSCDWKTLPDDQKAVFANFADHAGNGMTGEKFFELAVYQWIFVHELSHWWRSCQHITTDPYEEEKGANRLASAYWRDRDPAFYAFMLSVFQGVLDHRPSPVPPGQDKKKYFDDNYNDLPGGQAYSWYQSVMIIEVSKETPALTFAQAVKVAGAAKQE